VFKRELEKVNKYQAAIEHEKLRNSIFRKQTDDMIRDLTENRANQAQQLSAQQLDQIRTDINTNQQNLQELYFQNTRNEILHKLLKTTILITHLKSANRALETDVFTQLNNVNENIRYLEAQNQNLQQQNTQQTDKLFETRVLAAQTQVNLELQIQ
jgi:hypothetical protein